MPAIHDDILEEGRRLTTIARQREVAAALLGGVAIRLLAREVPPSLTRACKDLDFAVPNGGGPSVSELLREQGYQPEVEFNAINGAQRLLFHDLQHSRQVDVFVAALRMCHEIPLTVTPGRATITPAELLLTKLQIVELNEKDLRDTILLVHTHEIGADAPGQVDGEEVARRCARDWGLWRTITGNLRRCREQQHDYELPDNGAVVAERLDALLTRIASEPKTRGWKLRARIGERKRWYELPEEVDE